MFVFSKVRFAFHLMYVPLTAYIEQNLQCILNQEQDMVFIHTCSNNMWYINTSCKMKPFPTASYHTLYNTFKNIKSINMYHLDFMVHFPLFQVHLVGGRGHGQCYLIAWVSGGEPWQPRCF